MTTIKAFKAIRPNPQYAPAVASLPYDVMNTEEARRMAGDNPHDFLRVIRSELELDERADPYAEQVYRRAKENMVKMLRDGVLQQDDEERVYIYRLIREGHAQTGIAALSAVDEYESGVIKVHEKTRPEKEVDRLRHMLVTGSHTEPVFLTFRDTADITALIRREMQSAPLYDFTAADGVQHTMWRAAASPAIVKAFRSIPCTYIADGHHRAASSCRCRKEMQAGNPAHRGDEEYNFFLTVLFPHEELRILPYNRAIKKLLAPPSDILAALQKNYEVREGASPAPARKGHMSMYLAGEWYGLVPRASIPTDPIEGLDVSVLYERALHPVFGIGDQRTDPTIDYIGGIRGTAELERLVNSGKAACAFSLYPVSIDDLLTVADQGKMMAPKSTWFEPKLRSGLLVHRFGEGR